MREQTDHEDFYEAAQGEASDVLDQASLFVAAVEKYLRDQPILYCPLECAVEHQVDATYRGAAQSWVAMAAFCIHSAMLHQAFVHLLKVAGGQLFSLIFPILGMV